MSDWKLKYIIGDLVRDAEQFDVIVHGCNCFCNMGAGIAAAVKKKFPNAYLEDLKTQFGDKNKLGNATFSTEGKVTVVNAYTQYKYGRDKMHADYDAIRSCMKIIKEKFQGKSIGLPLIGAGLAGGDWNIIEKIITEELQGEDVTIVEWENA